MSNMRIAVMGAGGRMGRELIRAVHASAGCELAGAAEAPGSPHVGADAGELAGLGRLGIAVEGDCVALMARVDGIIDFTVPAASREFAAVAANARIVHVIGTTGFSVADETALAAAARHATIVKSGNMSFGVNLVAALTRRMAALLDPEFDIEIVEMHHRMKVDAPSGTALMLGRAAAAGRGITLDEHWVRSRDGHTGARRVGDIGFATLRGGAVVGDHSVIFAGDDEIIEITHRAGNRNIFARGAVKAALWARGRPPGLYTMTDVLGL